MRNILLTLTLAAGLVSGLARAGEKTIAVVDDESCGSCLVLNVATRPTEIHEFSMVLHKEGLFETAVPAGPTLGRGDGGFGVDTDVTIVLSPGDAEIKAMYDMIRAMRKCRKELDKEPSPL